MSIVSPLDVKIIFEDNHVLVVEKPVNMPTQKDSSDDMDFLSLLKENIKIRYNKPGEVYLGLVHRLDRPVGGIMVFAKTSKAASRLSEEIRSRRFAKVYLAVVYGKFHNKNGILKHYLFKDNKTNTVYSVDESVERAKEASLDYEVIDSTDELSLVRVNLHTGRSHQIRVQFSEISHPLYGDFKYGEGKNGQQIALWSNEITFLHPTLKEKMSFRSDPPCVMPWSFFL